MRHNSILASILEYMKCHRRAGWKLSYDLPGESYVLPDEQQPDIIAISENQRQLVMLELTVSFEENMQDAATRKQDRYCTSS